MGKKSVGGLRRVKQGGQVLDEARTGGTADDQFVEFARAGESAKGAFRCSGCGYGVAVQATLPQCPMCGGSTWELEADGR